jgi:hypothetical protein
LGQDLGCRIGQDAANRSARVGTASRPGSREPRQQLGQNLFGGDKPNIGMGGFPSKNPNMPGVFGIALLWLGLLTKPRAWTEGLPRPTRARGDVRSGSVGRSGDRPTTRNLLLTRGLDSRSAKPSPGGASVISQGREPLGQAEVMALAPEGRPSSSWPPVYVQTPYAPG